MGHILRGRCEHKTLKYRDRKAVYFNTPLAQNQYNDPTHHLRKGQMDESTLHSPQLHYLELPTERAMSANRAQYK